ncbi:VanZ family protein [Mucilaginibacter flavidus]|uniref:VanZ family protein n=1 Tax=Mucilaginibacter flavidus TaxID=2949309 RepID=UPI0020935262|nr:VanZ family protein [Mucilaginibacter flavidus]MCO5947335.1 VanZ family protein [Mucilaginibacter flavidus]
MKVTLKYYWPAILWALFILILCSIKLGEVSASPLFFPGFDKLVHCGLFFVMMVFITANYTRSNSPPVLSVKTIAILTVITVIYGGTIEILQKYIFTWRSGEWNDFFADIIGVLMAAFSIFIMLKATSYEKK